MKNKFLNILSAFTIAALATSCVQDDDYKTPTYECIPPVISLEAKTVTELKDLAQAGAYKLEIDNVVEAYVVSDDTKGNFYKSMSLVTADGTQGFQLDYNVSGLNGIFEVGRQVFINTKDLWIGKPNSMVEVGAEYDGGVGRIEENQLYNFVTRGCETISEDVLAQKYTSTIVDDSMLNTLIEFSNVQFVAGDVNATYYDADNAVGGATNHEIEDSKGNTLIVRTGEYASFESAIVPEGSGTIRGVLTKYGSTYQFMLRQESDANLTGERFDIDLTNDCDEITLADAAFPLTDGFDAGLANWNVVSTIGTRDWEEKSFGGNAYVQMSAYNSSDAQNQAWLISNKIDFSAQENEVLTFKTKDGYNNGETLTVKYSLDYDGSSCPTDFTWVELTATVSTGNDSGYGSDFISSGDIDLSALAGKATIAFVYDGAGDGVTTTMQIDDVSINNGSVTTEPTVVYSADFNGGAVPSDWMNIAEAGTKIWEARNYSGAEYMQMGAYNSGEASNKAWFISPKMDFDAQTAEVLTFESKDGYNNGDPVKLMYSTDYDGGNSPQSATWTELSATFSTGNTSGYATDFVSSGDVDLSALTGEVYVAFLYEGGNDTVTTTIQIDNFKVVGE